MDDWTDRVVQAIANNETLDHKHADSIFIGPTGSGKTSLLYRIIRKPRPADCSTGVAEDVTVVELDSNTWKEVGIEESLAEQVNKNVYSQQTKADKESDTSSELAVSLPPSESASITGESALSVAPVISAVATKPAVVATEPTVPVRDDLKQAIKAVMKEHGGYKNVEKKLESSLYMRDIGGQVEFQEIVSLLVFVPSIFFFVFRADINFKDKFEMEYRKSASESSNNKYTSSITLEEALLQSLASVYAMDAPVKTGVKPSVFIVATHKDKLGPSASQKIEELNEHLDSLIINYGFQDLVLYADKQKGQIMFTVNNKSEDEEDFNLIRSKVHSLINRDEFTIKDYPVSHILFSLELRSDERSIILLDECKAKAAKYGINENEVVSLLNFLHRIGVVQYYDVEGVRHIVVRKPEVLFSKATEVIASTFLSSVPCITVGEVKDFKEKGILSLSTLKSTFSSEDAITCEDFLTILEHLRIIAPLQGGQEKRYFIPCVLNHVPEPKEEDKKVTNVAPLAVRFKCKHCPKGLFGVLVAYLMAPVAEDSSVSLDLLPDKIFKDQVSFEVCSSPGIHDELSLRLYVSHIEIKYFPDLSEDHNRSLGEMCNATRQLIEDSMLKSIENLHYKSDNVKFEMCFKCSRCDELHRVEKSLSCKYRKIYCSKAGTTRIPMQGCCWYNEGTYENYVG